MKRPGVPQAGSPLCSPKPRDIRAEFCRTRSGFALKILTPLKILISVSGYDGQKKMGGIPLTSIDLVNHGLTGTDVIRNIF